MADESQVPDSAPAEYSDQDPAAVEGTQGDDFEASLEADINPVTDESTQAVPNLDGANDLPDSEIKGLPAIETRIPAKKDASLREFLSNMDDYAPIVRSLKRFTRITLIVSDS